MFLTDAQLKSEILRCEYCEQKPCKIACPVDCSPADFIMAAKTGFPNDFVRAAAVIFAYNPLGGVCGSVCPDYHCMKSCVHKNFDRPVNIPAVQAAIVEKAKRILKRKKNKKSQFADAGNFGFKKPDLNGKKIAIIGAGPSGLSAASVLAQLGYVVDIFEKSNAAGGVCNLIPENRMNKKILKTDIEFLLTLGCMKIHYNKKILTADISEIEKNYDSVLISTGLEKPAELNLKGEDKTINWYDFLENTKNYKIRNKKVTVVGGGAVAVDCAVKAELSGAESVEIICLEKPCEMPLTGAERQLIIEHKINVVNRIRIKKFIVEKNKLKKIRLERVTLPPGLKFHPADVVTEKNSDSYTCSCDFVIIAIGSYSDIKNKIKKSRKVFFSGDVINGAKTVVESVASGKNAAMKIHNFLGNRKIPQFKKDFKSTVSLSGYTKTPVPLDTMFWNRKIISPFILSASPATDGYEQMKTAYEHGWAGGIMKTAFDNVPVHIPSEYMFVIDDNTYGNCDNVSEHPLDKVCKEIEKLVVEFPDRLTLASTGGPVTGNSQADKKIWQSNTKKLEDSGAMGIEYSLSCPQGGDGTKGDIVSQNAGLTAEIIDWVMEISNPGIPKLFKLTAAVTSIYPIIEAVKKIFFEKYPGKQAGITLANSFPGLAFRKGSKSKWEEGIVIGLSGEGITSISNLTLANVSKMGMVVSGNGGPMDYKAAANFLALGVKTVQFCTVVMKYGYGIIDELNSGLSGLMKERGFKSVEQLIGSALPNPVTAFAELSPARKVSGVIRELCMHCGNCTRCPYLAITLNKNKIPFIDESKCIGCSLCVQKCFSGALIMTERT
ncbi:MAG: dihydropyrimidine dehydrogenase [Ignavibacteria bacterium]|nr:dihydropyrimidine dehydrogenase [Ignavibacteria bacterium]